MKEFNLDIRPEELALEERYLEKVVEKIQKEVLKDARRKKKVSDDIIEYRRNQIDEYRPDEDKQIDYFDHERFVQEESYKNVEKRLVELTELHDSPYFGKIGFREEGEGETIYVGKYGLMDESAFEPLVIDWRAPIASLFYKGSLGSASYKAPMGEIHVDIEKRRQFIIKEAKLKGVFDSETDVRDEILLEVLSSNAGKKLRDIIMTIQEEQDTIIRDRREGMVVVNGVAGSGKTTIALHRTAYLLYNYRKQLEDKVLILGPNNMFMDFIAQVLPSLGEEGVRNNTFKDFALEVLGYEGPLFSGEDYTEAILSGDKELIQDVMEKRHPDFLRRLDALVHDTERTYFPFQDVHFRGVPLITKEEMEQLLLKDFTALPFFRRAKRMKRLIAARLKEQRNFHFRAIEEKYQKIRDSFKAQGLDDSSNEIHMARILEIRALLQEVAQTRTEFSALSQGNYLDAYLSFTAFNFLTEADLAPMLYVKQALHGIRLGYEVKHMVLDEAQEFTPVHFSALRNVTGCSSFTVVGDVNQMILPGDSTMLHLEDLFEDVRVYNLETSYRSTYEIMEYANGYTEKRTMVPLVRNGAPVRVWSNLSAKEGVDAAVEAVAHYMDAGLETVGILTRDMKEARQYHAKLKNRINVKLIDTEDALLRGNLYIMPSYFAKGLEFDGVVILDGQEPREKDLVKYIMSTRALHQLTDIGVQTARNLP